MKSTMPSRAPSDIFEAMHDLMHTYRAHMVRAMASVHPELTLNEVRALSFVGRHPGATQKELVQHSGADKAQVARMVGMLEDKGWLERVPNAEDKRSRCLALSEQGQAVFKAMRASRQAVSATLLKNCDAQTQAQLLALLEQVRSDLEALGDGRHAGGDCSHSARR